MSELKRAGVYKPKKEIAKIDKKPANRGKDLRCKLDKDLGIDKPKTKHTGAATSKQQNTERTLQQLIRFNHSILEYMKKDQEIEEAYVLLEQHDAEPFSLHSDEILTPELEEEDLEATQENLEVVE